MKDDILDRYFAWLRDTCQSEKISDTVQRISFPFLDRKNDFTEIYIVTQDSNEYKLTDDGSTMNDLELSGFTLTPKRKETLNRLLLSFGVNWNETSKEIFVMATNDSLIVRKHMLINCLIKISDLFNIKESTVRSLFLDDVQNFLDEHNVPYIEDVKFSGRSKLDHQFDFAIPKTKTEPQRIIRVINNIDLSLTKVLIFSWEDTKLTRKSDSQLIPIINDVNKPISSNLLTSLSE